MNLLAKARKEKAGRLWKKNPPDKVELAVAWAEGELGIYDVARSLGVSPTSAYLSIAFCLAQHIRESGGVREVSKD